MGAVLTTDSSLSLSHQRGLNNDRRDQGACLWMEMRMDGASRLPARHDLGALGGGNNRPAEFLLGQLKLLHVEKKY